MTTLNDLASRAEGFLFVEGGSLTLKKLSDFLEVKGAALTEALHELSKRLEGRGLTLIVTETEATLAVSAETSVVIEKAYEKESSREIGDAGLEVLAILLYQGASTRSQIDYIRGVNTSSTIRTLLSRGLIERNGNPEDAREYLYRPTSELLAHLGVERVDRLPEYDAIKSELTTFEQKRETNPEEHHGNTDE